MLAPQGAAATAEAIDHWAFQPIRPANPPLAQEFAGWVRTPVDRFISASFAKAGLHPLPPAERRVLLRRLYLDLIGLPPSPEEVEAFVADQRPDAFDRQVDRLLDSPRYGERWGRWWLDLARYADTNGQDENKVMANAWRYRDWVIRSMNRNLPFDQFITHQIAGDLLEQNGVGHDEIADRLTATGFLVLGPKMLAEQDKVKLTMDLVDEQIDTVSRAFLGLTVGCARCHDHKFDPVPTRDYYALAGVFKSTESMAELSFVSKWKERSISTAEEKAALVRYQEQTNQIARRIAEARAAADAEGRVTLRDQASRYAKALLEWQESGEASTNQASLKKFSETRHLELTTFQRWIDRASRPDTQGWIKEGGLKLLVDQAPKELEAADRWLGSNAPPYRLGPGRVGAGGWFDRNGSITVASSSDLEPEQLTLATWVRLEEYPQDNDPRRWLVGKNDNEWAEGHYALFANGSRLGALLNIGGGQTNAVSLMSNEGVLPLHQWVHVAMTYQGDTLRLYVGGVPKGTQHVGRKRSAGSGAFALARRVDGYRYFKGALDEVRLYSRALSESELAQLAGQKEGEGKKLSQDQLARRWDFEPASETELVQKRDGERAIVLLGTGGLLIPGSSGEGWSSEAAERVKRVEAERDALVRSAPEAERFAIAVDESKPVDLPVHVRGNHLQLAKEKVPRGFLQVVHPIGVQRLIPEAASGRLQLAQWLTSVENPLTSRVIVNRIWQAHFGEGLVRSSDNFGLRGDKPTHPELLDWLAATFQRSGWNLKAMHRLLVSSATYQQASSPGLAFIPNGTSGASVTTADEEARRKDPENLLLARFPRQRLEAEMVRDSLLFASGSLDAAMGGSLVTWRNDEYVPQDESVMEASTRRSIYLPIVRDRVYDVLALFDFANPSVGTARRIPTVVSHQALFFLNSPLVKASSEHLARQLVNGSRSTDQERLTEAYLRIFGRPPSPYEVGRDLGFLKALASGDARTEGIAGWAALCQALMSSNEFVYRD